MTTNIPSQDFNQQIPVFTAIPDEWDEAKGVLVETLKKISNAVNLREVGWEINTPILTGKKYIPETGTTEFREISRLTLEVGPLPSSATKTVAHNLSLVDATFRLVNMYGAATDTTNFLSIPLPFVSLSLADQVEISMDATNFIITTGNATYSNYDHAVIIIEYTYQN